MRRLQAISSRFPVLPWRIVTRFQLLRPRWGLCWIPAAMAMAGTQRTSSGALRREGRTLLWQTFCDPFATALSLASALTFLARPHWSTCPGARRLASPVRPTQGSPGCLQGRLLRPALCRLPARAHRCLLVTWPASYPSGL